MNREIYVSEQAFLAIVFAAAEVYRRESYGLLFGHALPGKVIVSGALAYQTAERRFSEVALFQRQNKIIQSLVARFPKHEYLGEFHSHADFRGREAQAGLTPEDRDSMAPGEIALVVAVNPKRRRVPWAANADGSLSGTLGPWRFTLAGFAPAPARLSKHADSPRLHRDESAGCRSLRVPRSAFRVASPPRILRARVSCPYAVGLLRNA